MKHFTEYSIEEIENYLSENSFPKYRAKQIFQGIYCQYKNDFQKIINIPKALKEFLTENFTFDIPEIEDKSVSSDGTCKYLLKLEDNNFIECVFLPYSDRISLCVSTQVGCPVGCKFCASGLNGFIRNLNVWEIIGQILAVQNDIKNKITHIVFMGIGEPLLNLDNLVKSIKLINKNINISERRITVSTSGFISQIKKLSEYDLDITLALSLHSPFQEERQNLIPIAKYNILTDLLKMCDFYFEKTKRRITWEYILIDNLNCDAEHAKSLAKLSLKHKTHINLIPYNVNDDFEFKSPNENKIKKFTDILDVYRINYSLRKKKGAGNDSACGQLRNRIKTKL